MGLGAIWYSQIRTFSELVMLINSASTCLIRSPPLNPDPQWLDTDWKKPSFSHTSVTSKFCSAASPKTPSLIQKDLYFGLTRANGYPISDAAFQKFVDRSITPQFPTGLTIFNVQGQLHRGSAGGIKVITLYTEDTSKRQTAINQIVESYHNQFGSSVLQVTNTDSLKIGFGVGQDLIDNDPVPELIQVDLFFGRNIGAVEGVSQEQFQRFVDTVVVPRFPVGLTHVDARGQFLSNKSRLIREPAEVIRLMIEDTEANETAIDEIVAEYIKQFHQESVLIVVNEDITVAFGANQDLIDNDPIPEPIQVNLFFGRNIGGVEVSEAQFQNFLNTVIARYFSEFTVMDADGKSLSGGDLNRKHFKAVSFILDDTQKNEAAINTVVSEYSKQFQQEGTLVVVDEEIDQKLSQAQSNVLQSRRSKRPLTTN